MILEFLRNGIRCGKYDNSLLPKELELAQKFGVARGTVRRAFDHLVAEGAVQRKKHVGTVLCDKKISEKHICSVLRSSGHFYGDIFKCLQQICTENNYYLQGVDVYGYEKPKMRKNIRRGINSMLSLPVGNKFIVDGYLFDFFPMKEELLKTDPVFFDYFNMRRPVDVTGVMVDYYEIGRMGAKYLLEKGCCHPLLIIGDGPMAKERYAPEYFASHKTKKLIDGFSGYLQKAGLDPMLYIFFAPLQKKYLFEHLYDIFSFPACQPDGIFVDSDSGMVQVLNIAKACGYMPKYTLGCFDTPWCRGEGGFVFPSLVISPEACAKALLEQVMLPKELRKDVYIKPYLPVMKGIKS